MNVEKFKEIGKEYGLTIMGRKNEPHIWFTEFYPDSNILDTTGCELCGFYRTYIICWSHIIENDRLIQCGSFVIRSKDFEERLRKHIKTQLEVFMKYKKLKRRKKIEEL